MRKTFLLLICFLPLLVHADNLLEKFHVLSKTNPGAVLASEELGVNFLGGTGMIRSDVENVNPFHVSLPTFKAGCGGIDYTMGAIHIASGSEMKKALQSIISNGMGYAFQLSLETVAPAVAENVWKIQSFANQLNSININSCEIAQTLVNAAWPSSQHADRFICQQANGSLGKGFKDMIETRHKCHANTSGTLSRALEKQSASSDLLAGDYNLAKKVLQKFSFSSLEERFFLNLLGTVVSYKGHLHTYPPKESKTMNMLVRGDTLQNAYAFHGEYEIKETDLTIPLQDSWKEKNLRAMHSLLKKIASPTQGNGELTSEEKKLLDSSKLPLATLLIIKTRKTSSSNVISLEDYAEVEAYMELQDIVFGLIEEIRGYAVALLDAQISDGKIKGYIEDIDRVKGSLIFEKENLLKKITQIQQLETWLREVDKNQRMDT